MRQALLLLLVAAFAFSGCFTQQAPAPIVPAPQPAIVAMTSITPVAPQVLVSTVGHRIAEFMVRQDPRDADHLLTAFGDYDSPGGMLNCAFAVSFDGGATWTVSKPVPGFSGPYLQFDGWVDFDASGGAHGVCLIQGGPGSTTAESWPFYFYSGDGGLTWGPAIHIGTENPNDSTDKTSLVVGRDGTVYAAMSDQVARTSDRGAHWLPGKPVERGFSVFNGMVEDNEGTVFLLGLGSGDDIWVERSTDHGETWARAAMGPFHIPPGYNDQNRWVDQRPWTALPNLAHDALTDDLYVTYQSWDTTYGGYRLHLWRSMDHGATFAETPVPAFASQACADPCHVTHPAVAFDAKGHVGLLAQLTKDGGVLKVVQFSASGDHGATWLAPFELSKTDGALSWQNPNAFAPLPGNAAAIGTGLADDPTSAQHVAVGLALTSAVQELQMRWNGEYWGTTASSKGFVAMWIDHSADGRPQLYSRLLAVS